MRLERGGERGAGLLISQKIRTSQNTKAQCTHTHNTPLTRHAHTQNLLIPQKPRLTTGDNQGSTIEGRGEIKNYYCSSIEPGAPFPLELGY